MTEKEIYKLIKKTLGGRIDQKYENDGLTMWVPNDGEEMLHIQAPDSVSLEDIQWVASTTDYFYHDTLPDGTHRFRAES